MSCCRALVSDFDVTLVPMPPAGRRTSDNFASRGVFWSQRVQIYVVMPGDI